METATPPLDQQLLFGADPSEQIVAVNIDRALSPPSATVYVRESPTVVRTESVPFYPFFLLDKIDRLSSFGRSRFRYQVLDGANHYKCLIVFDSWADYYEAARHVEHASSEPFPPLYQVTNQVQQYLIQSGRTLFKGMQLSDVLRLQLDIEVVSDGSFPNAKRASDEIVIVALSDSTGWEHVVHGLGSETALLEETIRLIRQRDPDVIEGHNIFRFDLSYLQDRCARHGVSFAIGRDGSVPRVFSTNMRFAERSFEYPNFEVAGRHVIDTFLLAMSYDVIKRSLPSYGLKAIAKHFGFAERDRVYIDGDAITETWRSNPQKVLKYALDDVRETARIAAHLCGSAFYLSQMLPMNYQDVARTGPGIKIENLMLREYLRRRHSIPAPREIGAVTGAYTDVFVTGVVGPIVYADVESLYPSIMIQHEVRPATDKLGVFTKLLTTLTDLRLRTKSLASTTADNRVRAELDARQSSFKVLINAFYGYLGFGRALFNDSAEADRVTRTGQEVLRTIISLIIRAGGTIVEVDTDGVFFVPPQGIDNEQAETEFVESISARLPPRISVSIDGRFAKMLSYKVKNYALLEYTGKLTIKGSSLVSRSSERFGRRFVRSCIKLLLERDVAGLHRLYLETRDMILRHEWDNVDSFSRTETIKTPLTDYASDVETGRRTRSAAYEVARRRASMTGETIRVGDRISFYVAGHGHAGTAFENARDATDWSSSTPDENTEYYLRRLDEFASKFAVFFTPDDFKLVFSPEDLFGFDPSGIEIQTVSRPPVQAN